MCPRHSTRTFSLLHTRPHSPFPASWDPAAIPSTPGALHPSACVLPQPLRTQTRQVSPSRSYVRRLRFMAAEDCGLEKEEGMSHRVSGSAPVGLPSCNEQPRPQPRGKEAALPWAVCPSPSHSLAPALAPPASPVASAGTRASLWTRTAAVRASLTRAGGIWCSPHSGAERGQLQPQHSPSLAHLQGK